MKGCFESLGQDLFCDHYSFSSPDTYLSLQEAPMWFRILILYDAEISRPAVGSHHNYFFLENQKDKGS
jgi:hypothetical protein